MAFCLYIRFLNWIGIHVCMTDKSIKSLGLDNTDELIKYFGIDTLKDEEVTLRGVRHKVADRLDSIMEVLASYVQPDSSFIQIHDAQALDDNDKSNAVDVLKEFAIVIKESQLLELEPNEIAENEFCRKALEVYKKNVEMITSLITKAKDAYNLKHKKTADINYLG